MSSQLVISRGIDQKWKPFHREMRKLFASLLIAGSAYANEISVRSLQSGSQYGGTPIHDHGIHGEDQIIAVLDTGLDINSCYFVEADGSAPPINTGTPSGGYQWEHVNASRRKVIAYDFLYSCDQFPNAIGCDNPAIADDYDNQGHGTHAAASAAGDRLPAIVHDYADSIAPGAKLVIQDAGFIGGDNCSQRPGIGCPVNLTPILDQAYKQGARIHSNSWGDRQGVAAPATPPTANYSQSARDVDAFVYAHPDMLVVFNTGNSSSRLPAPASSLSAPGCAKNTLQVGGTRTGSRADDIISSFTLVGPTRDGRIKPDVVGPAYVTAGDAKVITGNECGTTQQPGTSWSSPTIAGAAALVRQYYTDGFYPTGVATPSNRFTPSAALMKATIIAAAHRVALKSGPTNDIITASTPSGEQGWGFPVLDDALYFPGDRAKLRVVDVPFIDGLSQNESSTIRIDVRAGTPLKAVLVWTDPAGVPRPVSDSTPELVNDLDLRVTTPTNATLLGNGQDDHLNNVEAISIETPDAGAYTITVNATHITQGPRQSYALVITGDIDDAPPTSSHHRAVRH